MNELHQEARFEYRGLPCVVLFTPIGYRCGYVGIPRGNKYYRRSWRQLAAIECHGGITYAEKQLAGQQDADTWWIGFDCGHWGDGLDLALVGEYFRDEHPNYRAELSDRQTGFPVRSLEYVEKQCRNIVDQVLNEEE